MKIVDIREQTFPISSPIRNAYIDFSRTTLGLPVRGQTAGCVSTPRAAARPRPRTLIPPTHPHSADAPIDG